MLSVAIVAVVALSLAAPKATTAQGLPSVHAGLAFSSHVEDAGVMAGGYFPILDGIKVGGEFTYYFTDDFGAVDFTLWTLNINALYNLIAQASGLDVSLLGGVNVLRWSGSYDGGGFNGFGGLVEFETSGTDIGLNAGAVAVYPVGPVDLFGKAHAVLGGGSGGVVIGAGISKTFGGSNDDDG